MDLSKCFKIAGVFDEMDVLARAQFLEGFLRVRPFARIRGAVGKSQLLKIIGQMLSELGAGPSAVSEWTSKGDTGLYRSTFMSVNKALRSSHSRSTDASDLLQSMMGLMGWEDESGEVLELGGKSPFWLAGKYAAEKNGNWLAEGMKPLDATGLTVRLAYRRALDVIKAEANYARKHVENVGDILEETMGGGASDPDSADWGSVLDAIFSNPDHAMSRKFFSWLDRKVFTILPPAMASAISKYLELLRTGAVQFKGTGSSGAGGGDSAAAALIGISPQKLWEYKKAFSDRLSAYLDTHPEERQEVLDQFADASFFRDLFRGQMHTATSRRVATAYYLRCRVASENRSLLSRVVQRYEAAEKKKTPIPANASLFLIHEDGANHILRGPKLVKLLRALESGMGGPEITKLVLNGYHETMGGNSVDSLTFESALDEATGKFKAAAAPSDPTDLRDPESGKTLAELKKEMDETLEKMYETSRAQGYPTSLSEQIKRYHKDMGGRVQRLETRIEKAKRGLRLSTNSKHMAMKPARGDWGWEGGGDLKISAIVNVEGAVVGWVGAKTKKHPLMAPGSPISYGHTNTTEYTPYTLEGKYLPGKPSAGAATRALDSFSKYLQSLPK